MTVRVGVLMMLQPGSTYIDNNIWRWFTDAGATIVPIPPTVSTAEAAAYFEYIHGLVLPAGWIEQPKYTALVRMFIAMGVHANQMGDYFPIWGTCQGFQHLVQYFGGTLDHLNSQRFMTGTDLVLQAHPYESRLLRYASPSKLTYLANEYVPYFDHSYGVTLPTFMKTSGLRILATSHDREGTEYVSMLEGIRLPFYGVQFHPERLNAGLEWMADFFVAEMKKSRHTGFLPGVVRLYEGTCERGISCKLAKLGK